MRAAMLLLFGNAVWGYGTAPEPKWFAVAATRDAVEPSIAALRQLRASWPDAAIVATSDCANLKPELFLVAAKIASDQASAQRDVERLRKTIPDAYLRRCHPKPGSRMQLGVPAVDSSIGDVPSDAVNWSGSDRISEVHPVDTGFVWLRRLYEKSPEDPREGRRTSVYFFRQEPGSAQKLLEDCTGAKFSVSQGIIALSCASETAGENLLHTTHLIDIASGRTLRAVERCRNPRFSSAREFSCEAESVGADGVLQLKSRRYPVR